MYSRLLLLLLSLLSRVILIAIPSTTAYISNACRLVNGSLELDAVEEDDVDMLMQMDYDSGA